jgi:hypothetical protein
MSRRVPDPDTAAQMDGIAAGLAAAGLTAQVHDTRGVLDLTAHLEQPGGKSVEIIVDDDGYTQVGYWNSPGAAAAQITATLADVLAAISSTSPDQAPGAGHRPHRRRAIKPAADR